MSECEKGLQLLADDSTESTHSFILSFMVLALL